MAVQLQDWLTNILGVQSVAQFGAKQPQYQHDASVSANVDCSRYLTPLPQHFDSASVVYVKENLAVVPEWSGGNISTFTL